MLDYNEKGTQETHTMTQPSLFIRDPENQTRNPHPANVLPIVRTESANVHSTICTKSTNVLLYSNHIFLLLIFLS